MHKNLKILPLFLLCLNLTGQDEFYKYYNNKTPEYPQVIDLYKTLDKKYEKAHLYEMGGTDSGVPLYLFLINEELDQMGSSDKVKLFINNGIHPGEPCGVDASLRFAKNILEDSIPVGNEIAVAIIPLYNVGGALNRNRFTRANQDGPIEHGFRGNAKNLDLNRDFIKMDSKNARSFAKAFHAVQPHVIVDTHTTNGADYQYNMTILPTAPEQLSRPIAEFFREEVTPSIYQRMEKNSEKSIPYVNLRGETPEEGINSYYDSPRYTVGYASLFHCWGFTSEAHMLKPFPNRVDATHTFLKVILSYIQDHAFHIKKFKEEAVKNSQLTHHPVYLELDPAQFAMIEFQGYRAEHKKSEITGNKRLLYNREKPETFEIRHYNHFNVEDSSNTPNFYVIPQAWKEIIPLLEVNQCKVRTLQQDSTFEVTAYYVELEESSNAPYEGHFLHKKLNILNKMSRQVDFRKGDFIVTPTNYTAKFLAHVLHPTSKDSYLRWNFFDEIFQQKEWFSSYVFEDLAVEILSKNPTIQEELKKKKEADEKFAESNFKQLYFIYKRSKYYEESHNRYPVYRYTNYK